MQPAASQAPDTLPDTRSFNTSASTDRGYTRRPDVGRYLYMSCDRRKSNAALRGEFAQLPANGTTSVTGFVSIYKQTSET